MPLCVVVRCIVSGLVSLIEGVINPYEVTVRESELLKPLGRLSSGWLLMFIWVLHEYGLIILYQSLGKRQWRTFVDSGINERKFRQ